ncbi:MAG: methyltransferase domain-containing protein [Candidatus Saccharimonadales bacterium]
MPSTHAKNYHKSRFKYDAGRLKVWRAINEYLSVYINPNDSILDLGTGYGDFINGIEAKKKYALDIGPDVKKYMNSDVFFINKPSYSLEAIPMNSLNVVFSSNLFEHLDNEEFDKTIKALLKRFKKNGKLILIGPNFKYAYKDYFDDYTHKTIYTHISLVDALREYGFRPIKIVPKFLPLTMKSRIPKSYLLTKAYLNAPISPLGKQMLLVLEVNKNGKK